MRNLEYGSRTIITSGRIVQLEISRRENTLSGSQPWLQKDEFSTLWWTSFRGALIRTIKEDFIWINEWDSPFDLQDELDTWINDYNTNFPHQSLMYATPNEFYKSWINKELELHKECLA